MAEGITYGLELTGDANGTLGRFVAVETANNTTEYKRAPIRVGDLVAALLKFDQQAELCQMNDPRHYAKFTAQPSYRPAKPGEPAYVEGAGNQVIDDSEPVRFHMSFW